ncbi:FtsX-like permease family protein [Bacteriovoracaceae bacterium]|nr:FtsX-like permease family protein [Bacteriovoracaceae bacterium]
MLFKMAIRNVFRQKRRTLFTALMMIGGFVLLSFSLAFIAGTYGDMISLFTAQTTGHVQIHNSQFVETESIHDGIQDWEKIGKTFEKRDEVRGFSFRIRGTALAIHKEQTQGAEILGIDWLNESNVTSVQKRLGRGKWPNSLGENEVVVGEKLSSILKVNLGDELILISQGADGSIANDIFHIVGIFSKEEQGVDDYRVYIDLQSAQYFYATNYVHEIVIKLDDIDKSRDFAKSLELTEGLTARAWQEIESDFYRAMQADKKGNNVSFVIIMMVVALGVLNTVLMSILERKKEFGVLQALGTPPRMLAGLIITETQIIVLISLIFGCIIASGINLYFTKFGISLPEPMTYGGIKISSMFARMTFESYLYPAIVIACSTLFISIYPAWKVVSISPTDAMREH